MSKENRRRPGRRNRKKNRSQESVTLPQSQSTESIPSQAPSSPQATPTPSPRSVKSQTSHHSQSSPHSNVNVAPAHSQSSLHSNVNVAPARSSDSLDSNGCPKVLTTTEEKREAENDPPNDPPIQTQSEQVQTALEQMQTVFAFPSSQMTGTMATETNSIHSNATVKSDSDSEVGMPPSVHSDDTIKSGPSASESMPSLVDDPPLAHVQRMGPVQVETVTSVDSSPRSTGHDQDSELQDGVLMQPVDDPTNDFYSFENESAHPQASLHLHDPTTAIILQETVDDTRSSLTTSTSLPTSPDVRRLAISPADQNLDDAFAERTSLSSEHIFGAIQLIFDKFTFPNPTNDHAPISKVVNVRPQDILDFSQQHDPQFKSGWFSKVMHKALPTATLQRMMSSHPLFVNHHKLSDKCALEMKRMFDTKAIEDHITYSVLATPSDRRERDYIRDAAIYAREKHGTIRIRVHFEGQFVRLFRQYSDKIRSESSSGGQAASSAARTSAQPVTTASNPVSTLPKSTPPIRILGRDHDEKTHNAGGDFALKIRIDETSFSNPTNEKMSLNETLVLRPRDILNENDKDQDGQPRLRQGWFQVISHLLTFPVLKKMMAGHPMFAGYSQHGDHCADELRKLLDRNRTSQHITFSSISRPEQRKDLRYLQMAAQIASEQRKNVMIRMHFEGDYDRLLYHYHDMIQESQFDVDDQESTTSASLGPEAQKMLAICQKHNLTYEQLERMLNVPVNHQGTTSPPTDTNQDLQVDVQDIPADPVYKIDKHGRLQRPNPVSLITPAFVRQTGLQSAGKPYLTTPHNLFDTDVSPISAQAAGSSRQTSSQDVRITDEQPRSDQQLPPWDDSRRDLRSHLPPSRQIALRQRQNIAPLRGIHWTIHTIHPDTIMIDANTGMIPPWIAYRPEDAQGRPSLNYPVNIAMEHMDQSLFCASFNQQYRHDPVKRQKNFSSNFPKFHSEMNPFQWYDMLVTHAQMYGGFVAPLHTLRPNLWSGTWFDEQILPMEIILDSQSSFGQMLGEALCNPSNGLVAANAYRTLVPLRHTPYRLLHKFAQLAGHPLLTITPVSVPEPCQRADMTMSDYVQSWNIYLRTKLLAGDIHSDRYYVVALARNMHPHMRPSFYGYIEGRVHRTARDDPVHPDLAPDNIMSTLMEHATNVLGIDAAHMMTPEDFQNARLGHMSIEGGISAITRERNTGSRPNNGRQIKCYVCGDNHIFRECPLLEHAIRTPAIRREILRRLKVRNDTDTAKSESLIRALASTEQGASLVIRMINAELADTSNDERTPVVQFQDQADEASQALDAALNDQVKD